MAASRSAQGAAFLPRQGDLATRIRAFDWASTPLGPLDQWPQSLKTATGLLLRSTVPMVMLWGPDGVMIYNDAYSVFAGGRHPKLLGCKVREGWPEVAAFNDNVMKVGLAGGTLAYRDQELTLHRSGAPEPVWMNLDYSPVVDESGKPAGVIAIVVETTERVLADRRAAAEQVRQRHLLQQMPGFAGVVRGPDHVYEYVNDAYVRISQRTDFIGRPFAEVFADLEGQGFRDLLDHVYASGEGRVLHGMALRLHGAKDPKFVDFVFEPIRDEAGEVNGVFIGGYEVTEVVRAKAILEDRVAERTAELRESERRLRAIFETGFQYQGLLTPDGILTDANAASLAGIGRALGDVVGRPFWETDWFTTTPGMPQKVREAVAKVAQGEALRREIHVNLPVGGWRWFEFSLRPIFDADGRVSAIVPEAVEFTERRRAEEALVQAQKMEAVGQLTGGIAHDFNNLLAGIAGGLELLEKRLAEGRLAGVERYIEVAQASTRRATALTQRLLAFSRRQTLTPRPTDVNRLIAGMEDMIRRTAGPHIEIEVCHAPDLWSTRVDASQLENALLNLTINARDAMPGGGRITITTANEDLDARVAQEQGLAPGQYISLCVIDNGSGMAPEVISRAFDPFYTTKPLGQGTGLGLSMVHGFVRQSGGQVRIDSTLGQGTTLCLYLPRYAGAAEAVATSSPSGDAGQGGGETILVIDDEEAIRILITDVLESAGYQVLTAPDGPSGLKMLEDAGRIDLLITDVGLPGGLNGRQVADAARAARPGLRILFATGYAEHGVLDDGRLEPGMEVIIKPFAMSDLTARVRQIVAA